MTDAEERRFLREAEGRWRAMAEHIAGRLAVIYGVADVAPKPPCEEAVQAVVGWLASAELRGVKAERGLLY